MSTPAHPGDRLSALLDGELLRQEAEEVEAHLAGCAGCREELEAVRVARAALRGLPAVDAPAGFFDRLLRDGLPEPAPRPRLATVVPIRRRRAAAANAAAAAVAGLVLLAGLGGERAVAVAPEVGAAMARHIAVTSGASAGPVGGVSRPFTAPDELAGYRLSGMTRSPDGLHLHYVKGRHGLSVFQQEGRMAHRAMPPLGEWMEVAGDDAWRSEAPGADGRVLVVQRGDLVVTFVGDESAAAVLAAARAFPPGSGRVAWTTRVRRACGDALEMLSPAG